jgi:DNA modification methylase
MTALVVRADAARLPLPDASVDLIVTSPPYFALRSYTDGGEHYAGQIGAEPTPGEYIDALLACTREWMRVLKPSGSCFVNLGDKYSTGTSGDRNTGFNERSGNAPGKRAQERSQVRGGRVSSMQPKSLLLLPELYRVGCVYELGLIARAVLVWQKPNGLPESVTDRVRRSHEDWVHLTREPRYFSAVDAIREPHAERYAERVARYGGRDRDSLPSRSYAVGDRKDSGDAKGILGLNRTGSLDPLGKLPGSVWEIATEPLRVPEHLGVDHFAAFPTEWPRRLILGWSPSGICTACGDGRRPVAAVARADRRPSRHSAYGAGKHGQGAHTLDTVPSVTITGESCACTEPSAPTRPAVVLDPFGGTGTTALVASVLGRTGISVDLSSDYCRLATWRTTDPGERARAMRVPKPDKPVEGQLGLFDAQPNHDTA